MLPLTIDYDQLLAKIKPLEIKLLATCYAKQHVGLVSLTRPINSLSAWKVLQIQSGNTALVTFAYQLCRTSRNDKTRKSWLLCCCYYWFDTWSTAELDRPESKCVATDGIDGGNGSHFGTSIRDRGTSRAAGIPRAREKISSPAEPRRRLASEELEMDSGCHQVLG